MPEETPQPLRLVSREGSHYVLVPAAQAAGLRAYLLARGVRCSPPEGVSRGVSSVTLGGRPDAARVQALLDSWPKSA